MQRNSVQMPSAVAVVWKGGDLHMHVHINWQNPKDPPLDEPRSSQSLLTAVWVPAQSCHHKLVCYLVHYHCAVSTQRNDCNEKNRCGLDTYKQDISYLLEIWRSTGKKNIPCKPKNTWERWTMCSVLLCATSVWRAVTCSSCQRLSWQRIYRDTYRISP